MRRYPVSGPLGLSSSGLLLRRTDALFRFHPDFDEQVNQIGARYCTADQSLGNDAFPEDRDSVPAFILGISRIQQVTQAVFGELNGFFMFVVMTILEHRPAVRVEDE